MSRPPIGWLVIALLISVTTGCGAPGASPDASVASPVTEAQARDIATTMLTAYNTGDYESWSRDWSEAMRAAIPAQAFADFRTTQLATTGSFQAIEAAALKRGQAAGVVRWEFTVSFEKGRFLFWIAFNAGSTVVDGVRLEALP